MKDKIEYTGKVDDSGKLSISNRKVFIEDLKRFAGKAVEIIVQRKRIVRSSEQNRYYWACVVPTVQYLMNQDGNEYDKQDVHEILKANFCYSEKVNESTGEVIRIPASTTRMSKSEFSNYTARINQFTCDFYGEALPEPETQRSIF